MIKQPHQHSETDKTKKWQAHHTAQAKSGLSRSEYCRRQQISYHAFAYWRKKLSKADGNNVALVPITIPVEPVRNIGNGSVAALTLVLPGKISIAVGDNFSGATLNRLLTVLAAR
jgi:hypothetical protein